MTEPDVFIISEPRLRWEEILRYLGLVDGVKWYEDRRLNSSSDAETLVEFMGKLCYRSWVPGLNPNVRRVRDDQKVYIANILRSKHGSVLEHAYFSFIFFGVSRVFTHELVRHRAGIAISQESMRFVRLTDIPFWLPDWAKEDEELVANVEVMLESMETFQGWMTDHFSLDDEDLSFHEKKVKTSFMRRFAPDGVATSIGWTANVRTLRHVIEARTNEGAEEEIRLVFDMVAERLVEEYPLFFGDFKRTTEGWIPEMGSKV